MTESVHREALSAAAYWFRAEGEQRRYGEAGELRRYGMAKELCFGRAADYAGDGEPECAVVYLRAAASALRIAEIEQDAIREAFHPVADEWWATHKGWPSTSYGPPWSTPASSRLDSNAQPAAFPNTQGA